MDNFGKIVDNFVDNFLQKPLEVDQGLYIVSAFTLYTFLKIKGPSFTSALWEVTIYPAFTGKSNLLSTMNRSKAPIHVPLFPHLFLEGVELANVCLLSKAVIHPMRPKGYKMPIPGLALFEHS